MSDAGSADEVAKLFLTDSSAAVVELNKSCGNTAAACDAVRPRETGSPVIVGGGVGACGGAIETGASGTSEGAGVEAKTTSDVGVIPGGETAPIIANASTVCAAVGVVGGVAPMSASTCALRDGPLWVPIM